jgi:hypothetical protein
MIMKSHHRLIIPKTAFHTAGMICGNVRIGRETIVS